MPSSDPLVIAYAGTKPTFRSAPRASRGAAVLGRATLGAGAVLGEYAVIRADGHYVTIGDNFWLGPRATVHIAHNVYPTHVGDNVTASANSIIHACDVGSNCVLGRDVVILDGSKIADDVMLADGSLVFPRSVLESGWLYAGQPAKPVRRLEPGELLAVRQLRRGGIEGQEAAVPVVSSIDSRGDLFLACTARARGQFSFGAGVGIWFGCDLDAGSHRIYVGDGSNIQDNTVIRSIMRSVSIGREATIGHNVTMVDCEVGDRSLIGMGANVAAGTLVQEDVLLAAGARTTPDQILDSGWLYGGSPARRLSKLDENKRGIITSTWPVYMEYARSFDAAQSGSREDVAWAESPN